ncbi:MAG: CAP domain-containing protein, partial [Anaerolineales bacterium]|nr:CAP domain-containing protein [Anaerolineales bacterium]
MMRQISALSLSAVLLGGCTVAPEATPTATPVLAVPAIKVLDFTPTPTLPPTATLPPTETPVPTLEPSATPGPKAAQPQSSAAQSQTSVDQVQSQLVAVAPPQSAEAAAAEQYTVDLINAQRTAFGVAPLGRDETLMGIARARVADMIARGYTGHSDPVTGEALARKLMRAAGYTSNFLGENWYGTINPPPKNAEVAMNWFMTDPPHSKNILNPNFAGVG